MAARLSRRDFLTTAGTGAAAGFFPSAMVEMHRFLILKSPFKLSIITDEISQDLGHALEVASKEFGLGYVELRGHWNKNIINLDETEIAETRRLLKQYGLQVTDIASPLFKTDWPGAPKSKYSPDKPQFGADYSFAEQGAVMERSFAVAKALGSSKNG
jgi:hypothetical protein